MLADTPHNKVLDNEECLNLTKFSAIDGNSIDIFQHLLNCTSDGLALLNTNYQLLYFNTGLESCLQLPFPLLKNTLIYKKLKIKKSELFKIHTVLQNNKVWIGSLTIFAQEINIEINKIPNTINIQNKNLEDAHYLLKITAPSPANKMDTIIDKKNDFLAQMSHELRTPLNAILGFSQLLESSSGLTIEQMDNLGEIQSASDHLLSLVNNALDASSRESNTVKLAKGNIDLESLVQECLALTSTLADSMNVSIKTDIPKIRIFNDRVRLKQVLLNLLKNAIQYNYPNGSVVIRAYFTEQESIRLEIQDSGKGIAQNSIKDIFSPFKALNNNGNLSKGAGIGLMISRRLIRIMNGDLTVASDTNFGSIFTIELPLEPVDLILNEKFNTTKVSQSKLLRWIDRDAASVEMNFCKQLLKLRPHIKLQALENTNKNILSNENNDSLMLIIPIKALEYMNDNLSSERLKVLKKSNLIVVVNNNTDQACLNNVKLNFLNAVLMPMCATNFMEIMDRHFGS